MRFVRQARVVWVFLSLGALAHAEDFPLHATAIPPRTGFPVHLHAEPFQTPAVHFYRKIDAKNRIELKWNFKAAWVMDGHSVDTPLGQPVLKIWFVVDQEFVGQGSDVKGFKSKLPRPVLRVDRLDSPYAEDKIQGEISRLDTQDPTGEFEVYWRDVLHQVRTAKIQFEVDAFPPSILIDQTCDDLGIDFRSQQSELPGNLMYLGLRCEQIEDKVMVGIAHSHNLIFQAKTFFPTGHYEAGFFTFDSVELQSVKLFELKNPSTGRAYDFELHATKKILPAKQRFSWFFGTGLAYQTYSETVSGIYESQYGVMVKGGLDYLSKPTLVLGLSGFYTVLPIVVSRTLTSTTGIRYGGVNFRVGFMPATTWLGFKPTINLGAYVWFESFAEAGFSGLLAAPQLLISLQRELNPRNSFSIYVKTALMLDGTSALSFANRELAVGGGFFWKGSNVTHGVTLDFADLAFRPASVNDNLQYGAFSLSYQFRK